MKVSIKGMIAAFMIMLLFLLCGCMEEKQGGKKQIDFTVCDRTKLPDELVEIVEERKGKEFKLTYINNNYMYIAVGYGERDRQDYRVVVEDLYITDEAIFIETNLYTEQMTATDAIGESSMYPYIVVKCEKYDVPVVYNIR